MSSNSAGNDAGKSRQSLLASRNRYHWVGERKQDKEGPHYNSVYIARRDIPAFILNEQDTVQMDGPDDDRPFVGIVLRLYEANSRKTMDIEWFYLKEEIVQFAPRSHNNIVIEDREVFLAEGEVEIVENFLGSVKNPCYIVYITPQDSLLPQNQRAITHSKFFEVYFCRYSFNEQKNTTTAITPSLAANKYLLKNWHTIPEPIRNYLQKDISLPCFKNVTVNDVKLTLAIPSTTIKMGGNLKNILTVWGNTAAQLDGQQSKSSKEGGAANTSVRKKPTTTTTTTTTTTAAATNGSTASVTSNTTAPASTVQSTRTPLKSISCSAAAPLDNKRVLSLDVYDLAQNIMFQDIDFSSSDADSTDSETLRRRRHQQGYIRTKGRSSAVKRQQCGEDKEFVLARWSDLSEQQRKAYFLQARSMKDTALCSTTATNKSSTAATTTANAIKLPTDPPKWKNRSDSVSSVGGRAQQQSSRSKASSAKSGTSPSKLPSAASVSNGASEKKEGEEDSSGSEDRFSDIDQQEYSGLLDDISNPYMPDEDLSYRLFCYEHDLYASSSTPSGSSSSEGRRRQPRVKTPAELAQRAKKQADRKYREWTDLSFKKLKTFTKRAQRLRQYHAHVSAAGGVQGKAGTAALGEGSNHAAAGAVAVGSREEVDEAILQAVTAGLGKYEIALQLLASDLSKEPRNSSSSGEEPQVAEGKRRPRRMSEGGQNGGRDGKEGAANSLPTTRRSSEPSIMHQMSRVIDQFGALPPRRQSEYMKRAAALQVRCGVPEQANDYNVGTSVRNRGKVNTATAEVATQQKAQQESQQTRRASTSTAVNNNNTSTTNSRRRVSAPPAVPTQTVASSSDEADQDQQRRVPQRKRKTADDVLLEEIDQGRQKLTRHSFSERRSRYEEVKLKREIAVSTTAQQSSLTRRRSSGQRTRISAASADVQPASSSDNRESEDSGNDESELPAAAAVGGRTSWRVLERQRREQRKESYKLRIEKRRASSAGREAHRQTAAAAVNTHRTETERPQPVHALIPTFAAHQLAGTTEGTRQSRRTSDSRRMPVLSAVESLSVAVASRIGKRRRSGQSEQANSDNEVFASSTRRSGSTAAAPPSDRTSPSDLHSLASASVESASEAENSVISGDEELRRRDMVIASIPLESTVYSTRGKARRDSVVSQVEFMHRSPTHRGRVEPRIGEHYQVTALPECVDITTETMSAVTSTRRSRSANMSNRVNTSSAIWQTASALATTGGSSSEQKAEIVAAAERLQEVAEYLQRADALIAELKAEKLKSYFEQQAKVAKQGALLTAQQQRFAGRPSLGIAALGQDESKLPVDSTDATLVVASGEVPVVVHQALMDCEYDTELALEQLPGLLEPLLTLWTSAEQQSIGAAFERSGMSKKALCGAVAGSKSDAEVWEYTLRFLAAAEELEENTTYTNADGIDCIIPAIQSTAYQYPVQSGALSTYSSSVNLAGEEGVLAEGSKFLERLSASVDEASFWQLLFSLSTLVKSGQCSPAQMVVKAHYILSAATYDAKLSYTHRVEAAQSSKGSPNSSSSSSNSSECAVGLPVDDTAMALSEDPPVVASSDATAVPSRVSATETVHNAQTDTTSLPEPEPQMEASLRVDTSAGTATTVATAAGTDTTEKLRDAFHCKEDAISCFNLFLPVLVSQR